MQQTGEMYDKVTEQQMKASSELNELLEEMSMLDITKVIRIFFISEITILYIPFCGHTNLLIIGIRKVLRFNILTDRLRENN